MERASKALRRSSVKLRSMGSTHSDLQLAISELRDVRNAARTFASAQNTAAKDMLTWAAADENRAIQDAFQHLNDLHALWTDVQKDFAESLKVFRHQFEMILEGEREIDRARAHLTACEGRESKLRKELKRAAKKATAEELQQLEMRLIQAEKARDLAQNEVLELLHEHEAVKLMRMKDGLFNISEAYIELANKCQVIFEAEREVALQLPDVQGKELHEVKYTGSGLTRQAVIRAKDRVLQYQRQEAVPHDDPPPPYEQTPPYNPYYPTNDLNSPPNQQRDSPVFWGSPPERNPRNCEGSDGRKNSGTEDQLSGAMGGLNL